MKHHEHFIGWKRANRHDVPLWAEYLAFAGSYLMVIGLMVLVVELLVR